MLELQGWLTMLLIQTTPPQPKNTHCHETISLSDMLPGVQGKVVELSGGRGFVGRMASLGFTPGVEISLVQNCGYGPLIACVRGTRVALGRQEAKKTFVQINGS
jgi:ferrous iron transport protein A